MNDLISRQAAIDAVNNLTYPSSLVDVKRILVDLPSAQPEIIRCKECKHSSPNGVYGCRLERYNFNDESVRMYGEDYCSYGERRTDEVN